MPDLNCHITTFNCGREEVQVDYFASSLHTSLNPGNLPPDLIVLALQEISPIGFSFLGGSFLAPYFARLREAVLLATAWAFSQDVVYEHVLTRNVGMIGIMVFAKKEIKDAIRGIQEAGTGVGLWEMGNKGAVGVRLRVEETAVTFVAAHLAPAEDACERRNQDWKTICENLVFESADKSSASKQGAGGASESEPLLADDRTSGRRGGRPSGLFGSESSYVFFAGDLNYRTSDTPPDSKDHESWPQPMAADNDPAHFTQLLSKDQLTREMSNGRTLHHLAEAPISFPPTYKYSDKAKKLAENNARQYSSSSAASKEPGPTVKLDDRQEQVWLWAKHRVPSWCDRVLYLADASPKVQSYTALPVQPTSDHRPVSLSCSIPMTLPSGVKEPPFEIVDGWRERRANARRLEILVGIGAYLSLTGQGQAVLAGSAVGIVGVWFLLHSIL
jgi:hypothetical protein